MNSFDCQECGIALHRTSLHNGIVCQNCGTVYENKCTNINGEEVVVELGVSGYMCLEYSSYLEKCSNHTVAPHMYCEHHSSDEYIYKMEDTISNIENNLKRATDKLDKVKESRRNWMISKLGGISE